MFKAETIETLQEELQKQTFKFPKLPGPFGSVAILTEETGEVARACLEDDTDNLQEELMQVACFALRWLESLGGVSE